MDQLDPDLRSGDQVLIIDYKDRISCECTIYDYIVLPHVYKGDDIKLHCILLLIHNIKYSEGLINY
jgi:hypothetical protein